MNSQKLIGPAGVLADLVFDGQACRAVPGFDGLWVPESGQFMVSTRIRHFGHSGAPTKLVLGRDRDGYWEYRTAKNRRTRLRLHNAVLLAWRGPANGRIGLHRDDCKDNNAAANLEWGTHADNGVDKRLFGTAAGERNSAARMDERFVIALREEAKSADLGELRRAHPTFSKFALWAAVTGYTWAHLPGAIPRNRRCSKDAKRTGK